MQLSSGKSAAGKKNVLQSMLLKESSTDTMLGGGSPTKIIHKKEKKDVKIAVAPTIIGGPTKYQGSISELLS